MTETIYTDHSTFGGRIYENDFDAHYSMSDIASRIISDQNFDKYCMKCAKDRERKKKINKQYIKLQEKKGE